MVQRIELFFLLLFCGRMWVFGINSFCVFITALHLTSEHKSWVLISVKWKVQMHPDICDGGKKKKNICCNNRRSLKNTVWGNHSYLWKYKEQKKNQHCTHLSFWCPTFVSEVHLLFTSMMMEIIKLIWASFSLFLVYNQKNKYVVGMRQKGCVGYWWASLNH